MTLDLREFYGRVGGNFEDALRRLGSEACLLKFLGKLLTDRTYSGLTAAMAAGDAEGAFTAAHSLKGICLNFGLSRSAENFSALTESLRPRLITPETAALYERTAEDYQAVLDTIALLFGGEV